jgi:hypothetical protein
VPAHIATKMAALLDRPDSLPGRKDRQELLNLLALPGSAGAPGVIKAASARTPAEVAALMQRAFVFLSRPITWSVCSTATTHLLATCSLLFAIKGAVAAWLTPPPPAYRDREASFADWARKLA